MAIESNCSGCGQRLSVDDQFLGKQARCPACGEIYRVAHGPTGSPDQNNAFGLDETTYDDNSPLAGDDATSAASASADEFWMRAPDGSQFGPVDRATLDRWFQEGRVGDDYTLRQGSTGVWSSPASFQASETAANSNPFASGAASPYAQSTKQVYSKADRSGVVLAMGILSIVFCGLFGIVAWVMGASAIQDIRNGDADPTNLGITQVGYYLGIVSVLLHVVCGGGVAVVCALASI